MQILRSLSLGSFQSYGDFTGSIFFCQPFEIEFGGRGRSYNNALSPCIFFLTHPGVESFRVPEVPR